MNIYCLVICQSKKVLFLHCFEYVCYIYSAALSKLKIGPLHLALPRFRAVIHLPPP